MNQFILQQQTGLLKYRDWFLTKLSKLYSLFPRHSIFREEWDNCIILDACRYDIFKRVNWLDGSLEKINSVATHTIPFCHRTFTKEKYDDTILLSANPHVDREVGDKFHDIIPIWKQEKEEHGTTVPKLFVKPVRDTTIKYPNKRLLLWFIQPHTPYLGYGYQKDPRAFVYGMQSKEFLKQYQLFFWAHLSQRELRKRYVQNLIKVLMVCEKLLDILRGTTVITSDHGEALGERIPFTPIRIYGHYNDIKTLKMIEVPYLTIPRP
jgi:hypothetical protein